MRKRIPGDMDHIEKLFRKITADERALLASIITKLKSGETTGLHVKKLSGSDFYRLRKGMFRIIFHYEHAVLVIDTVRLRNEKTYRGY
jgi:mRNA-degrading endonuclease RelE of RelBE toxin-antitoxin system